MSLCVSGRFQERWYRCSGQEDSAGGFTISPSTGYSTGSVGLSIGFGTEIPLR